MCVYTTDFVGAAARIAESYNTALSRAVSQPVLLLGDFNSCDLSDHLPTLHQYVDCPTRLARTLDKCYGNILDAYKSICRPALGKSDHNVVHLLPSYRTKLRREKTVIKEIKIWTEDCMEEMKCELETTDWLFLNSCDTPHELIDTFTSYLLFNESKITRTKIVRIFPNNNLWMSSDLKECIREKKHAFKNGNIELLKKKRSELRSKLSKAKIEYKDKVECQYFSGNAKKAWEGLNVMMGRETKQNRTPLSHSSPSFANDLNVFFSRFDKNDFSAERDRVCRSISGYVPITLNEHDIIASLSSIKPNSAPGPDGLRGRVLKENVHELKGIVLELFQYLLNSLTMPKLWKMSYIVPIPKKPGATELEDFRPIALTSILGKCFERVISKHITASVSNSLDYLQFAYKIMRGTDDATVSMFHTLAKHLQAPSHFARALFIDFTSAFNSMQIHTLLQRLIDIGVNGGIIHLVRDFLSDRPQQVLVNNTRSDILVLNTGAPQGTILSPLLFSIYTNEFQLDLENFRLFKYADDMALVALLKRGDIVGEEVYRAHVSSLQKWCDESSLEINVTKTKELVFYEKDPVQPLIIRGQIVEVVEKFKYLGTYIDSNLNFSENIDYIFKTCNQRLHLLRKLNSFRVSKHIMEIVYKNLIESILTFNMAMWYGNLNVKGRSKLQRIVNLASKIIGTNQKQLSSMYEEVLRKKAFKITNDPTHPLNREFELLPSARRYRVPRANRNIFKNSFIPNAIRTLNNTSR